MLNVLITGAAGLIGGEISARVVAAGHRVTAVVHRERSIRANDGSDVAIEEVAPGDVSAPRFGWTEDRFADMAGRHDVLVHCAATTRFDLKDECYQAVNVDGTGHAIHLAEAGNMTLLHVSTAYVCGERSGVIREDAQLPEDGFANAYEFSKANAERLVHNAARRWIVARPSIVVGDSVTGSIRRFDSIYAAFGLIARGLVKQLPARPAASLDFVPIDHVARGILALVQHHEKACGGTFHLVSTQPLKVTDFVATIGTYPQFHAPRLVPPECFDPRALPIREQRLYRHAAGLYASYFQRDPCFDDSALRELTGLSCPPTGAAYLRRLIEYGIASGFLPSPAISEHPDSAGLGALEHPAPT